MPRYCGRGSRIGECRRRPGASAARTATHYATACRGHGAKGARGSPGSPTERNVMLRDWLTAADSRTVSDAGWFSPNTFFSEFSARKLSNARFRGVGSSPANPGITSYIDGVPQLNANSSSIEFIDVEQVEFVRGPQSALFGRNALGGVINIMSRKPSLKKWNGSVMARSAISRAATCAPRHPDRSSPTSWRRRSASGSRRRDGFTTNDITGHNIDSRSATFGKAQLLWKPNARWEARGVFSGERARDGDYSLSDLGAPARATVSRLSRRRRLHPSRHPRADGPRRVRRNRDRFLDHHRLSVVEDRRPDRPRLHAACRSSRATTPKKDLQFTEEAPVRVGKDAPIVLSDSRDAEVAGRRCSSSHRTTRRTRSTTSRRSCCRSSWHFPSTSTHRRRRSTIAASASTARPR